VLDRVSRSYSVLASRRAAARAAGIAVKSQNLYEALPNGIDRARVWILPNGIDLSRFQPQDRLACRERLAWDNARGHVLFPAPPDRSEKRFALAQAAVAQVSRSGADIELHSLVGIPHEEVPTWLNAADAVLLTSTHEGSPNAVKEALACNVPVVSVDVGDVRERIEGIEGCFIADATPGDLAAKLRRVLERRVGIEARARIAELSVERVAEKLLDIYRTLTEQRQLRT
jgi:glycosyltransferase involved in cell wall biosynthesis